MLDVLYGFDRVVLQYTSYIFVGIKRAAAYLLPCVFVFYFFCYRKGSIFNHFPVFNQAAYCIKRSAIGINYSNIPTYRRKCVCHLLGD